MTKEQTNKKKGKQKDNTQVFSLIIDTINAIIGINCYPVNIPVFVLKHAFVVFKQGPALYAYNNAMFTKEDWKGIRLVSSSVKVQDPMKVGRFGLGFKSVFHLTGT